MNALPAPAPSLAQLLLDRFGGRRSAYARRRYLPADERWGYIPARRKVGDHASDLPLTVDVVERHLAREAEGDAIGVYLVPEGDRRVTFAVLDIDNHGGDLPWLEVAAKTRPIVEKLRPFGRALAVRSGGGSGIHLVLFFAQPEEATKVRSFLRIVLGSCGLHEGPGGIEAGAVEVFPKQDDVKVGEYGNLISLPFARASVPLDDDLKPLSLDAAVDQLAIVPDFDLPETRADGRRRPTAPDGGEGEERQLPGNVVPFPTPRRAPLDPATETGVAEGSRDEMCWRWAGKWRRDNVPIEEAETKMDVMCDGHTPPFDRAIGREKLHRLYAKYPPGPPPRIETTDTGNADFFARLYGDQVRYDHARKRWLIWAGHWWTEDRDGEITRLAIQAMTELGKSAFEINGDDEQAKKIALHALKSRNLKPLENLKKLAQDKRPISDTGENWDREPWTFGVANGVIDLMTGQLRPGRQEDRITMHSGVAFDPDATCPEWKRYLAEMYSSNVELIDFIHRMVGYSLTGNVREEVLTFHLGSGSNGKSLLLEILAELFGDYGHTLSFTQLEGWAKTQIPTEIAAMVGKRLIVTSEADERAELNCARLKSLGSRDRQTARHLYAKSFQFMPTQHYWIALNHPPKVNDDTDGFWRRVALVPYRQKFEPAPPTVAEREPGVKYADKDLGARIIANELPGILAWAVRGCLEWQQRPLTPFPAVIAEASAEYRADEDVLAEWIRDKCEVGEGLREGPRKLYNSYCDWARDVELPLSEKLNEREFKIKMLSKFPKKSLGGVDTYRGISLPNSF